MTKEELEVLFPIGNIIELKCCNCIAAKTGAKAIVKGYKNYNGHEHECWLVSVEWIRDELSKGQQDGGYFPEYFMDEKSTTVNKKEFPHQCPHCNSPAYIGLNYIECSKKCQ